MELTRLELDFLKRLINGVWTSPPLFDHSLVVRLVEHGYVTAESLTSGEVRYAITEAGVSEIISDEDGGGSIRR